MNRRSFLHTTTFASAYALVPEVSSALNARTELASTPVVQIKADLVRGRLPHIWEECVGSDRAIVGLREQWLTDLVQARETLGIKTVRFHGLFNDEMGVWPAGAKQPNFLYVDMVFDAILERGIKPFVELSFMPATLASGTNTVFFYRGNTTPPKELAEWAKLVGALGKHCVDRYGI